MLRTEHLCAVSDPGQDENARSSGLLSVGHDLDQDENGDTYIEMMSVLYELYETGC